VQQPLAQAPVAAMQNAAADAEAKPNASQVSAKIHRHSVVVVGPIAIAASPDVAPKPNAFRDNARTEIRVPLSVASIKIATSQVVATKNNASTTNASAMYAPVPAPQVPTVSHQHVETAPVASAAHAKTNPPAQAPAQPMQIAQVPPVETAHNAVRVPVRQPHNAHPFASQAPNAHHAAPAIPVISSALAANKAAPHAPRAASSILNAHHVVPDTPAKADNANKAVPPATQQDVHAAARAPVPADTAASPSLPKTNPTASKNAPARLVAQATPPMVAHPAWHSQKMETGTPFRSVWAKTAPPKTVATAATNKLSANPDKIHDSTVPKPENAPLSSYKKQQATSATIAPTQPNPSGRATAHLVSYVAKPPVSASPPPSPKKANTVMQQAKTSENKPSVTPRATKT
jgi:hypothetical protein